jgi:hypothetical protein
VVFPQRSPAPLRLVAYLAAVIDFAVGVALILMALRGPAARVLVIPGAVLIVACGLVPWILLGVRYELEDGELLIRRGPFASRIPLGAVDEVRISAPLPALTGVVVTHHRGGRSATVPLFPAEPEEFLRQVEQNTLELEPVESGVLRRRDASARAGVSSATPTS